LTGQQVPAFFRFCAVGVAGLLVDSAVLYALAPFLGWYAARVLSFLAAASATWWLNRRYTFPDDSYRTAGFLLRQYLRYLQAMLLGGLVNYGVYAATVMLVSVPGAPLIGVCLGSIAGLTLNFVSARYIMFAAR
jgi:putative flippase GtrA